MTRISATGPNSRRRITGFTLVEILVVLAIAVALVASVSVAGFRREATLKNRVEDIALNLRLLRHSAQLDGEPRKLAVHVARNRLVFPQESIELGEEVSLEVTGALRELEGESVLNIVFFPDGSSSGGVIRLEAEQEQYEISVVWISGKVQVSRNERS